VSEFRADVAVVGAGPAGMAAALAAADLGARVMLVDAGQALGGQIYRQAATAGAAGRLSVGPKLPQRLRRVERHPRIRYQPGTTVWQAVSVADVAEVAHGDIEAGGIDGSDGIGGASGIGGAGGADAGGGGAAGEVELRGAVGGGGTGFKLWLTTGGRAEGGPVAPDRIEVRAVVVATGATEISLPFPGWELPGVTTVGAAQALLKGQGVVAGRRVLVAGSGPLLLPAAAGLAEAGVEVVAVLEANPVTPVTAANAARLAPFLKKAGEAGGYGRILARRRVRVRAGYAVTECRGDGRVEQATVSRVDRDWRPAPGTGRPVAVDAVHVSFGFSPALELPRRLGCADLPRAGRPAAATWCDADQATSVPGVFAAGETTGVAGADVAELEGYVAGASAARFLQQSGLEIFDLKASAMGGAGGAARASRAGGAAEHEERALQRVRVALDRARRFAGRLEDLYPWRDGWLDWPRADTVVCRCEEVPWAAIGAAAADGARDVRAVKGVTRCGMGYCQGRVCGPALQQAVAAATGRGLSAVGDLGGRPLLTPVSLGAIAAADRD
jgi:thioredoxin reductase